MNSSAAGFIPSGETLYSGPSCADHLPTSPSVSVKSQNADNSLSLQNVKQFTRAPRALQRLARHCLESFLACFFHALTASSHFSTILGRGSFRTIDPVTSPRRNWGRMARYSSFLGRRVEVQYRAGDILLPASGIFVADSGRSIFLEQNFEQRGQHKHFRWEIPYQYLVRIEEKPDSGASANSVSITAAPKSAPEAQVASKPGDKPLSAAATASAGGAPGILPLPHRPKTA